MRKKKVIALNKEDFIKEVSAQANYLDPALIEQVYYGLVRVIGRELKAKGAVDLPDLGLFLLHRHKERNFLNVNTGRMERLEEKNTIKFRPCYDLKKFFHLQG